MITGIGHQSGLVNGLHSAMLIIVRGVAADADGAQNLPLGITNQHTPSHRNYFASGQAVDCIEKRRHRLRTPCQLTSAEAHSQAAARFAGGDLRAKETGLFIAQDRQWMTRCIQHDGGQGLNPALSSDPNRAAGDVDGGDQIKCVHDVDPHTAHLPSWATRSRVYRSVHFNELKSDTCLGL